MSSDDEPVVGIDFGTTNCVVAFLDEKQFTIVPNSEGYYVTPSAIEFEGISYPDSHREHRDSGADVESGEPDTTDQLPADEAEPDPLFEFSVGQQAQLNLAKSPDRTLRSVKRYMGSGEEIDLGGHRFSTVHLASWVFQRLKHDLDESDLIDHPVENCVVTVPTRFTGAARDEVKEASKIAGFNPLRVIDEPVAAAMSYGYQEGQGANTWGRSRRILVFDLGGGTLDVSIVEKQRDVYEVRGKAGNVELGGDDWDARVAAWMRDEFIDEHGEDPYSFDPGNENEFLRLAREAKERLSSTRTTAIQMNNVTRSGDRLLSLDLELTREKFDDLTADLLARVDEYVFEAIDDAGVDSTRIQDVVLVGGSALMPQVEDRLVDLLDRQPKRKSNPAYAVAEGAALEGANIMGRVEGVLLLDVLSLSLGIRVRNDLFERIIPKNTAIPAQETRTFTTAAANQTAVDIMVYQGERDIASENDLIGRFTLKGIPPAPAGTPQINITFSVHEDGAIDVQAEELGLGLADEIEIVASEVGLTESELEVLKREAERYAKHDARRRKRIELRNRAEKAVQLAHGVLSQHGDSIDPELYVDIEVCMEEVVAELKAETLDMVRTEAATSRLTIQVQQVGRDVYQPDQSIQREHIDVVDPIRDSKSARRRDISELREERGAGNPNVESPTGGAAAIPLDPPANESADEDS